MIHQSESLGKADRESYMNRAKEFDVKLFRMRSELKQNSIFLQLCSKMKLNGEGDSDVCQPNILAYMYPYPLPEENVFQRGEGTVTRRLTYYALRVRVLFD